MTCTPVALPTLTAETVMAADTLLDARAPERFLGHVEPIDPIAGHIPGACNAPSTGFLAGDGTFLDGRDLARLFGDVDGVGAYCGSGVTASVVVAALATLGIEAALFPGRGRNGVLTQRVPWPGECLIEAVEQMRYQLRGSVFLH